MREETEGLADVLEIAVVTDVDAARVGCEVPGAQEEDGNAGEGPEKKLDG
jgi:hypothetical protein